MSPTHSRALVGGTDEGRRRFHRPKRAPSAFVEQPAEPDEQSALESETRLSERFAELVGSHRSVLGFAIHDSRAALQTMHDIRALPKLIASLPAGDEASAVREQMMRHGASRRAMCGVSAVLELPTGSETYLEGRDRATVRRKMRAAAKQGVVVRPVPDGERTELLNLADRHEQDNEREAYRTAKPENGDLLAYRTWFAAYDADGQPLALAVTPVAGEWATLRYFRTLRSDTAASDARYAMTAVVAEALRDLGVRHLVDTARPHWLPNGLRHFQRMVGFRLVRVSRARISR